MRKKLLFMFLSIFIISFIASCGDSDRREIEELLSDRKNAFETKNLELYMSCISPSYKQETDGKVIGIEDIKRNFLSNVTLFDQIKLSYFDRNIQSSGDKATATQKTRVDVSIEDDKSKFQISENIGFQKINGKWKIVKESQADFLTGFVFGGVNQ
ncbi:MAG: nuclear transport factor 2 family protein [Candidatus Dadabacteria bacterium]|nr:nuclear transport factor 2 family protein [Candidatus Dadabacteria bacterium]